MSQHPSRSKAEKIAPGPHPTPKTPAPRWITCGRYRAHWTGLGTTHCSGCHRTFTGVTAFDIHRRGGQCHDPATVLDRNGEPRLVPVTRRYWIGWGQPGQDTRWDDDQ